MIGKRKSYLIATTQPVAVPLVAPAQPAQPVVAPAPAPPATLAPMKQDDVNAGVGATTISKRASRGER